jgi:hypothetical protein
MKQRIYINLATKQMEALQLHWRDPDVMTAITMLLIMSFIGGVFVWVAW